MGKLKQLVTATKRGDPRSLKSMSGYETKKMHCPASMHRQDAYAIPLDEIDDTDHNPARTGGTNETNVTQIFNSLVTSEQEEPICVVWLPSSSKFVPVFGYNRIWASQKAARSGLAITNTPDNHIWAYLFTGSTAEKTLLQMRENGNKKPGASATQGDIVSLLKRYIETGGFDKGYETPWSSLNDEKKRSRAQNLLNINVPFWAGQKFKGVWNRILASGEVTSFKTWPKPSLAKYECAHGCNGLTEESLELNDKLSGTVIDVDGNRTGFYFVSMKSEASGALPTNASKKRVKGNLDRLVVIATLNGADVSTIDDARESFKKELVWWNENIMHTFDEILWMPQTKPETEKKYHKGEWAKHDKL